MQLVMSDRFRSVNRQMSYLMPPSLDEWLPEDHLARFVVETVDLEFPRFGGQGVKLLRQRFALHTELVIDVPASSASAFDCRIR